MYGNIIFTLLIICSRLSTYGFLTVILPQCFIFFNVLLCVFFTRTCDRYAHKCTEPYCKLICVFMYASRCVCLYVCTYEYYVCFVYMYVCMCIYIHIYIHTHTYTHTLTHTHTHTHTVPQKH